MSDKYIIPPAHRPGLNILRQYYKLQNVEIVNSKNDYDGAIKQGYTRDAPLPNVKSVLGTAVYSDLSLMGCAWSDVTRPRNPDGSYPKSSLVPSPYNPDIVNPSDLTYLNLQTVIITVSQPYEIVETKIQGRNGTVKEYIGAGSASVSIQGIIVGQNGVYPRDTVRALKAWCDAPVAKRIVAWWLQNLNIDSIVVKSVDIPQVAGGYSYQPFTIQAIADAPVELLVSQPANSVLGPSSNPL